MNSKFFGSILIIAGTSIGAGMLMLPIISANVGFMTMAGLLVLFYFLLLIPGFAFIELSQFGASGTTVSTLMEKQFGKVGYTISHLLLLAFVYSVMSAYFGGVSGVLAGLLNIAPEHQTIFKIAVCLPLGLIVIFTSRLADIINRAFFYLMCITFVVLVAISLGKIEMSNLTSLPTDSISIVRVLPILYFAYGYHVVIPSIMEYLDNDKALVRKATIIGLAIPLVIFLIWTLVTHGVVTQQHLIEFAQQPNADIGQFINANINDAQWLGSVISVFSLSALVTSFIGLSLALIIILRETFKDHQQSAAQNQLVSKLNSLHLFVLAIILPLGVVLVVPNAFSAFLSVAAVLFTVQSIIFPIILLALQRTSKNAAQLYSQPGVYRSALPTSVYLLFGVFSAGCAVATLL